MEHRSGERPGAHDEDTEDSENGQLAQNAPIVALKVPTRGLKPIDPKPMRSFPNFARYHMSCVQKNGTPGGLVRGKLSDLPKKRDRKHKPQGSACEGAPRAEVWCAQEPH